MKQAVFGLIGAGGISRNQHLPNMARARNIKLKTVCDLRKDVLEEACNKYRIPCSTTDYHQVLNDPEIQAVLVATKADSHVPLTIDALKAGKHVYVEKPLAETSEQCRKLLEVQKATGKIVAVGFNRRMAPAYIKAKEIINKHGGVRHFHYRISDAYFIWGAGNEPGQRIIHEVCHIFDICRYFADSEVKSVYCASARADDETIVLQFESGCVGSIMSSGYVNWDMPKEALEVILNIGAVTVDEFVQLNTFGLDNYEPRYLFPGHMNPDRDVTHRYLFEKMGFEALIQARRVYYENQKRVEELRAKDVQTQERKELEIYMEKNALPQINYMVDKGWLGAIDHFAECILDGTTPILAGAEDGLRAARITEAAIQSREKGKVVFL